METLSWTASCLSQTPHHTYSAQLINWFSSFLVKAYGQFYLCTYCFDTHSFCLCFGIEICCSVFSMKRSVPARPPQARYLGWSESLTHHLLDFSESSLVRPVHRVSEKVTMMAADHKLDHIGIGPVEVLAAHMREYPFGFGPQTPPLAFMSLCLCTPLYHRCVTAISLVQWAFFSAN